MYSIIPKSVEAVKFMLYQPGRRLEMKSRLFFVVPIALLALVLLAVPARAGDLNPPGPPGPTMKTLDQIPPTWDQILPADDSTTPDGCNSSRFKCVMGGNAVVDKETGLVWEKLPDTSTRQWPAASGVCFSKTVFNRSGWRLPTIEELATLWPLPVGHPFTIVQSYYWSATTNAITDSGYVVNFGAGGGIVGRDKLALLNVWCVRGGHGSDGQ
jgi:hypothetical protein